MTEPRIAMEQLLARLDEAVAEFEAATDRIVEWVQLSKTDSGQRHLNVVIGEKGEQSRWSEYLQTIGKAKP